MKNLTITLDGFAQIAFNFWPVLLLGLAVGVAAACAQPLRPEQPWEVSK